MFFFVVEKKWLDSVGLLLKIHRDVAVVYRAVMASLRNDYGIQMEAILNFHTSSVRSFPSVIDVDRDVTSVGYFHTLRAVFRV